MHIKIQLQIAPPRPINVVSKLYLVAKPDMTEASGNFETGPCFVSTLGLILAHWHFSCKVTPNPKFLLKPAWPLLSAVTVTPFPSWLTLTVVKVIELSFPRKLATEHLDV